MKRPFLLLGLAIALVAGFLLFRPDKLFADDPVDESLAEAFVSTAPPLTRVEETAPVTSVAAPTTLAAAPATVGSGQLTGIDHRASGTASIYEESERFVLRLEDDTDIQNGPDLYVWVLEGDQYRGGTPSSYLDLGKLKGNVGGQNYEVPAEFDPDLHRGVLIWCLRFAVPFAFAPLS